MNSVRHVALISPPMTTMASGFCVSDPIPVEMEEKNHHGMLP
jgi:hypothetical protein